MIRSILALYNKMVRRMASLCCPKTGFGASCSAGACATVCGSRSHQPVQRLMAVCRAVCDAQPRRQGLRGAVAAAAQPQGTVPQHRDGGTGRRRHRGGAAAVGGLPSGGHGRARARRTARTLPPAPRAAAALRLGPALAQDDPHRRRCAAAGTRTQQLASRSSTSCMHVPAGRLRRAESIGASDTAAGGGADTAAGEAALLVRAVLSSKLPGLTAADAETFRSLLHDVWPAVRPQAVALPELRAAICTALADKRLVQEPAQVCITLLCPPACAACAPAACACACCDYAWRGLLLGCLFLLGRRRRAARQKKAQEEGVDDTKCDDNLPVAADGHDAAAALEKHAGACRWRRCCSCMRAGSSASA
jgi:hypothetical protein